MDLILDTVEGCEAEIAKGLIRTNRGAVVKNLDVTEPREVLLRAMGMPGMPIRGDMLSPRYPNVTLDRIAVRAVRGRIALFRLVYQQLTALPDGVESFAIEDVTTLSTGTTQFLPGTLKQLRVSYTDTETESDLAAGDTATISFPVPMRSLILWGMFSQRPPLSVLGAMRRVNDSVWMGLPKGFWLFSGVRVQWSNRDNRYRVTCTVTTKSEEDWSSYSGIRGPDGKWMRVPQAIIDRYRDQDYDYGIRNQSSGLLKVGPFKLVNMRAVFGIG